MTTAYKNWSLTIETWWLNQHSNRQKIMRGKWERGYNFLLLETHCSVIALETFKTTYTQQLLFAECWIMPFAVRDIDTFITFPYLPKYSLRWSSWYNPNKNVINQGKKFTMKKMQKLIWSMLAIFHIDASSNS